MQRVQRDRRTGQQAELEAAEMKMMRMDRIRTRRITGTVQETNKKSRWRWTSGEVKAKREA